MVVLGPSSIPDCLGRFVAIFERNESHRRKLDRYTTHYSVTTTTGKGGGGTLEWFTVEADKLNTHTNSITAQSLK
jgi:hypothetical protein